MVQWRQKISFWLRFLTLVNGIRIYWGIGYKEVFCVSDSLTTVYYILHVIPQHHQYSNEVEIIQSFFWKDWSCTIMHSFREGNRCADCFAKLGATTSENVVLLL